MKNDYKENMQETDQTVAVIPSYYGGDEKLTLDDFRKHVSGPMFSIITHVAILIILSVVIVSEPPPAEPEELPPVVIQTQELVPPPIEPPLPEPPEIMPTPDTVITDTPFDSPSPVEADHDVNLTPDVVSATAESEPVNNNPDAGEVEIKNAPLTMADSNSALKIPGMFALRGKKGREGALRKYNKNLRNGVNTEKAVLQALKWLKSVQNPDGSWGDEDPSQRMHMVQLTSMSLLAFLGHGETQASPEFGETVRKGLQRMQEWIENPEASHGVFNKGDNYAMARAGIVMSEAYALTRIPSIERSMNKIIEPFARKVIVAQDEKGRYQVRQNGLNPNGGYHSAPYMDGKTGAWHMNYNADLDMDSRIYNALYSALAAGCEVKGLDEAVDIALHSISTVHCTADGGFNRKMTWGRKDTKGTFEDTAAGTLYMYLMGGGKSKQAAAGLHWLETYKPNGKEKSELKMDWHNLPGRMSILGWYYMTQALFQGYNGEGENWKRWNSYMATTLVSEQHKDGYWPCPSDKYPVMEFYKDSKGKERKREVVKVESSYGGFTEINGRIWATMYFCLCLEVYYRYLPTFTVGRAKPAAGSEMTAWDSELEDMSLD